MRVWYLDDEDELTDAVARIRGTDDDGVILVVPTGSKIATGRINFRLLAREAAARDKALAIASDDEQVLALVAAAGVLGHPTVAAAEAALERGDEPPEPTPPSTGVVEDDRMTALDADVRGGPVLTRRRALTAVVAVVLGLSVGTAAALQVLPTAEIVIVPGRESVGPLTVPIEAASTIDAVDVESGRIPAETIDIPLAVEGEFEAGGSQTVETRAAGVVTFSSTEQTFDQRIEAGTGLETAGGVSFRTTAPVVLERPADGPGPAEIRAPIEAVAPGPEGNVAASAISVVPSLAGQGIGVTNDRATSGGRRDEIPVVTVEAYDAAAIDLQNRLTGQLAASVRERGDVSDGLRVFPETQRLGTVTFEPTAEAVVGTREPTFALAAATSGQVLAVDEALVESVAAERLLATIPEDRRLIEGTLATDPGAPSAGGGIIRYAALAEGDASVVVDPQDVLDRVRGLTLTDAEAALEAFGTVEITVWPDFLDGLPDSEDRITLTIKEPRATE